jgi:hypothetical protein
MFDSPLEWCDHCKAWVALDQTFAECSRECRCTAQECPLAQFMTPPPEASGAGPQAAVPHLAER